VSAEDSSLAHLFGRLQVVEARARAAVWTRRARDSRPDDRFRGLYISDEEIDQLLGDRHTPQPRSSTADSVLARVEARADAAEATGADIRLRRLARSFELTERDLDLLVTALAPDLDARFERLFAYLHDDVTRGRASTGLALELCGAATVGWPDRRRLAPGGPLVDGGLLLVEGPERPFLTRPLRVPDRVIGHLLGDDSPDELLAPVAGSFVDVEFLDVEVAVNALRSGELLFYVQEQPGAAGYSFAARALAVNGRPVVSVDLDRLDRDQDVAELARTAVRDARLLGAGILAGPVDAIAEGQRAAVRMLAEAPVPVFLVGRRGWDPEWSRETPIAIEGPVLAAGEREAVWRHALNGRAAADIDPSEATAQFRLTPDQVARAARAAQRTAEAERRALRASDLQSASRAQSAAGLERLARRIRPRAGWDDLVLPAGVVAQLRELAVRLRQRERVLDSWGMGRASSRGRGVTGLFAGDSGTGKTMSAEVVAADLGLDLYVVDLSTVVDKYVGETEKNLDRVFVEASRVNGVLLFDEADALFGKRSEVKDARDRWANVEVAYLLQRMEQFDGIAILTTNLRANVDEAFTRRLDSVVDFPMPDEEHRRRLWEKNLNGGLPLGADIDTGFLASSFRLSGGHIRNIVLTAAYLAADDGGVVGMPQVARAIEREYRKLGRLCVEGEFGHYYALVSDDAEVTVP
jgi:hypothetical protein